MSSSTPTTAETIRLARALAVRLAAEMPELLPALSTILERIKPKHGPGYGCVNWFGAIYCFSPTQAKAIEVLWQAWETGVPDVHANLILNSIASNCDTLADLLKSSKAWNVMVVPSESKGMFRLQEPGIESQEKVEK